MSGLALSWEEFCDKTPFELSMELEGHFERWEDAWKRARLIATHTYNSYVPGDQRVLPYEFMPLSSDRDMISLQNYIDSAKFAKSLNLPD